MSVIIRLQNLPWSANSYDIRQYFQGLSIPEGGVHIVGGELGDAFIAFSTDEDARQAMMRSGGKLKEVQVSLMLSSRSEMQRVIEAARSTSLPPVQPVLQPPPMVQMPPAASTNPVLPIPQKENSNDAREPRKQARSRSKERSRSDRRDNSRRKRSRSRERRDDRGDRRRRRSRSRSGGRDRYGRDIEKRQETISRDKPKDKNDRSRDRVNDEREKAQESNQRQPSGSAPNLPKGPTPNAANLSDPFGMQAKPQLPFIDDRLTAAMKSTLSALNLPIPAALETQAIPGLGADSRRDMPKQAGIFGTMDELPNQDVSRGHTGFPDPGPAFGARPELMNAFGARPEPSNVFGARPEPSNVFGGRLDTANTFGGRPEPSNAFGNRHEPSDAFAGLQPTNPFGVRPELTTAFANRSAPVNPAAFANTFQQWTNPFTAAQNEAIDNAWQNKNNPVMPPASLNDFKYNPATENRSKEFTNQNNMKDVPAPMDDDFRPRFSDLGGPFGQRGNEGDEKLERGRSSRFGNDQDRFPPRDFRNSRFERDQIPPERPNFDRPKFQDQSDPPPFNRDSGLPFNRDSVPPFNRDSGPPFNRDSGPPFNRDSGPPFNRDSGPPFNRDSGPTFNRDSGPTFNRDSGPPFNRESVPPFDRDSGPPFNRDSGPPFNRDSRPPFNRDSGPPFNRDSDGRTEGRRNFNDKPRGGFERNSFPPFPRNIDNDPEDLFAEVLECPHVPYKELRRAFSLFGAPVDEVQYVRNDGNRRVLVKFGNHEGKEKAIRFRKGVRVGTDHVFVEHITAETFHSLLSKGNEQYDDPPRRFTEDIDKNRFNWRRNENNDEKPKPREDVEEYTPMLKKSEESRKCESNEKILEKKSKEAENGVNKPSKVEQTHCLFVSNLPGGTTDRDVFDFFSDIGITPKKLHLMLGASGEPSGESYVEFWNTDEAKRGCVKNGSPMGRNTISVRLADPKEVTEAVGMEPEPNPEPEPIKKQEPVPLMPLPLIPRHLTPERLPGPGPGAHAPPLFQGRFPSPHPRFPPESRFMVNKQPGPPSPNRVVVLSNIPYRAEVDEIVEFLGPSYNVTMDNIFRKMNDRGQPTSEARVVMPNAADAERAVNSLRTKQIRERPISLRLLSSF